MRLMGFSLLLAGCLCVLVFAPRLRTYAGLNCSAVVAADANRLLLPDTPHNGFSVEVWACMEGSAVVSMTALSSGRFELGLNSRGQWKFTVFRLVDGCPLIRK